MARSLSWQQHQPKEVPDVLRTEPKESRSQASLALAVLVHAAVGGIVWSLTLLPHPPPPPPDDDQRIVEAMIEPHRGSPAPRGGGGRPSQGPRRPRTDTPAPPVVEPAPPEQAEQPEAPTVAEAYAPEVAEPGSAGAGSFDPGGDGGETGGDGEGPDGDGDGSGGDGDGDGDGPGSGGGEPPNHEPRVLSGEMTPPRIVHRVEPKYSRIAQVSWASGKVVLRCIIEVDGSVRVTEVLRSVTHLTEPAIEAVEQWRYEPALWRGRPQAVFTTVHVTFQ